MARKAAEGTDGAAPVKLPPGYPMRFFDEAGNEIFPQEVRFKFSGGAIDLGGAAVPHLRRKVQGTWKGILKGGGMDTNDSRDILLLTVSVEDATIVEVPESEQEGTIQNAVATSTKGRRSRKGAKGAVVPMEGDLPDPHGFTGEQDGMCAVAECGRPAWHPIHTDQDDAGASTEGEGGAE